MITVGLADDDPLFTAGLSMILDAQPGLRVSWQAGDGAEAVRRHDVDPVDVLLLDIQMPGTDGLTATRRLVTSQAPGKVVIVTTFDTDDYVLTAIEAGAAGFLLKNTPPDELVAAVRTVHRGDAVISPGPTRRLVQRVRAHPAPAVPAQVLTAAERRAVDTLTERERQVLTLITQGLTNQEICDRLWLSMPTVKTHVGNLIAKTHARDRVQLVLFALRTGLVGVGDALQHAGR
ncbi:response regulator [Promicromonospora iranensis]|uniref:response regulator n=1 Tax=Promicromonospora iranensis TaxID=1105144 RepID=UPI0023A9D580|nr:response regulator transcription factor [Promicromonospora iranensis]